MSESSIEQRLDFDNGKYTLILAKDGYTVTALRYGEPWRDFVGDSFISYLAQAVFEKAQAPTDECKCKRRGKKVSMSGEHVNKTADSLHVPTDAQIEASARAYAADEMTDEEWEWVKTQPDIVQPYLNGMRAALIAAFTAGQEDKP